MKELPVEDSIQAISFNRLALEMILRCTDIKELLKKIFLKTILNESCS